MSNVVKEIAVEEVPQGCSLGSAERLAELLKNMSVRLVLAESCTAGFAAASLGSIPGISEHFCGSVVAYRDQAKIDLLGVDPILLEKWSSVSEPVAAAMARNVLLRTPEANFAASITGHFGPKAPGGTDGMVFIGLAWRPHGTVEVYQVTLRSLVATDRIGRQQEAANLLLLQLDKFIRTSAYE